MFELLEKCLCEQWTYFKRGGYVLSDGRIEEIPQYVIGDHDTYALEALEKEGWSGNPGLAYDEFLNRGNIRWLLNEPRSEMDVMFSVMPSESQIKSLYKLAKNEDKFFFEYKHPRKGKEGSSWKEFLDLVRVR